MAAFTDDEIEVFAVIYRDYDKVGPFDFETVATFADVPRENRPMVLASLTTRGFFLVSIVNGKKEGMIFAPGEMTTKVNETLENRSKEDNANKKTLLEAAYKSTGGNPNKEADLTYIARYHDISDRKLRRYSKELNHDGLAYITYIHRDGTIFGKLTPEGIRYIDAVHPPKPTARERRIAWLKAKGDKVVEVFITRGLPALFGLVLIRVGCEGYKDAINPKTAQQTPAPASKPATTMSAK